MSSKWIVKIRDYELEQAKYQIKGTTVIRNEDPLNADEVKFESKKKIIKSIRN